MSHLTAELSRAAQELQPELIEYYRVFHRFAETSGKEFKTSQRITEILRQIPGLEIREHVAGYGVLATLCGAKPGKTIALRADIDALPIEEHTGLSFQSDTPGVMHACGHDNHITMLLGAAMILSRYRENLHGQVRFFFQPSEEAAPTGGSRAMIAEGAMEGVDAIFGLHVWPELPVGTFGVKSGAFMANSDYFTVTITGKGCHAATPHMGYDALTAAAQFINSIHTIVSRNIDPLESAVITIGKCKAGSRYNVVAETCLLEGTCRTYDAKIRDMIEHRLQEILDGICQLSRCQGTLNYTRGYTAIMNDKHLTDYFLKTATSLFGNHRVIETQHPSMGADDFAFYQQCAPGCFFWLGTAQESGTNWPLHNSHFAPDNEILWQGASMFAKLAFDFHTLN